MKTLHEAFNVLAGDGTHAPTAVSELRHLAKHASAIADELEKGRVDECEAAFMAKFSPCSNCAAQFLPEEVVYRGTTLTHRYCPACRNQPAVEAAARRVTLTALRDVLREDRDERKYLGNAAFRTGYRCGLGMALNLIDSLLVEDDGDVKIQPLIGPYCEPPSIRKDVHPTVVLRRCAPCVGGQRGITCTPVCCPDGCMSQRPPSAP